MVTETAIKEQERDEQRRQFEAEIEPLVAMAAPEIHEADRVLLGPVQDLVPSHTEDRHAVPEEDQLWFRALGAVAHRYGLTYEMVDYESGRTLWLIPQGRHHG